MPSASALKARQRPSGDRPAWRENSTNGIGVASTQTPPASARSHSPARSAWQAMCSDTSEDEHAVSIVTAGPSRPSTYATRPEMTLVTEPVSRRPRTSSGGSTPTP